MWWCCGSNTTISIHALREEGDLSPKTFRVFTIISIHALREEGDKSSRVTTLGTAKFLSTPSARRATSPSCLVSP